MKCSWKIFCIKKKKKIECRISEYKEEFFNALKNLVLYYSGCLLQYFLNLFLPGYLFPALFAAIDRHHSVCAQVHRGCGKLVGLGNFWPTLLSFLRASDFFGTLLLPFHG